MRCPKCHAALQRATHDSSSFFACRCGYSEDMPLDDWTDVHGLLRYVQELGSKTLTEITRKLQRP